MQISSWILLLWHDQDAVHSVKQGVCWPLSSKIFWEGFCAMHIHWNLSKVQGYVKTTHSVVLDYAVDVHVLNDEDLQLSYGELGNFRWFHYLSLFQEDRSFQKLWYIYTYMYTRNRQDKRWWVLVGEEVCSRPKWHDLKRSSLKEGKRWFFER